VRIPLLPLLITVSITTTVFTFIGLAFGARLGERYERGAERFAGTLLILLALYSRSSDLFSRLRPQSVRNIRRRFKPNRLRSGSRARLRQLLSVSVRADEVLRNHSGSKTDGRGSSVPRDQPLDCGSVPSFEAHCARAEKSARAQRTNLLHEEQESRATF
jgi:hypothetical protein